MLGSGTLAARLTHRQLIVGSTLGLGIILFLLSRPQPLWLLTANLLLLGLCAGIYLPSGMATLTSIVKPRHWGKAIAVHEIAPNLGFVLAPFLAEAFLRWSSWRGLLMVLSGGSLLLGLAYTRYGRGGTFQGEAPTFQVVSVLLRDPSFWIMIVMFGLGIGTSFGSLYHAAPVPDQ